MTQPDLSDPFKNDTINFIFSEEDKEKQKYDSYTEFFNALSQFFLSCSVFAYIVMAMLSPRLTRCHDHDQLPFPSLFFAPSFGVSSTL